MCKSDVEIQSTLAFASEQLKDLEKENARLKRLVADPSIEKQGANDIAEGNMLQEAEWRVGVDRARRIWRCEGLKVPKKQRPRGRLWLNNGSCVRLRPKRCNHIWPYDFVKAKTHDGRKVRLMTLIDEVTRLCLAIRVARWINGIVSSMLDRAVATFGKPTDNALIEGFNARVRLECLNQHWFLDLDDARAKIEHWHRHYYDVRPHGAIGERTPMTVFYRP